MEFGLFSGIRAYNDEPEMETSLVKSDDYVDDDDVFLL